MNILDLITMYSHWAKQLYGHVNHKKGEQQFWLNERFWSWNEQTFRKWIQLDILSDQVSSIFNKEDDNGMPRLSRIAYNDILERYV